MPDILLARTGSHRGAGHCFSRLDDGGDFVSVILILILISLTLALGFLACFVWAVRSGQYEDTLTPSMRILSEDQPAKKDPHNS